MSVYFDDVQEYVWQLTGTTQEVEAAIQEVFPYAYVEVKQAPPMDLPPNVEACCGSGEGTVTPVLRYELQAASANVDDIITEIKVYGFWTSPYAKWDNSDTWDLFFWDNEVDDEVFL